MYVCKYVICIKMQNLQKMYANSIFSDDIILLHMRYLQGLIRACMQKLLMYKYLHMFGTHSDVLQRCLAEFKLRQRR